MTRSIVAFALTFGAVGVLAASGCKQTGIGDPCIPEQEYNATFNGFDPDEVVVESRSFQCQTRVCLVNHFRGRTKCPYGQDSAGQAPSGAKSACTVPGSGEPVTGAPGSVDGATVKPWCVDRPALNAVYCSCRCANVDGKKDDGANYCDCPDGFVCQQLVSSTGYGNEGLTGAYCIKKGTVYEKASACGQSCDPTFAQCGEETDAGK
jgi:hypothetical protein